MKQLAFGTLVLLSFHFTYGQETKTVTRKSLGFREVFNVRVTDKKIKHGSYKKYEGKDNVVAEGAYENNVKVGEWKFYVDGQLEQTYNFSTRELQYARKAGYPSAAMIDGTIQLIQLDTYPAYVGLTAGLNEELNNVMKYPNQALRMGISGKVLASVWVSESGEVSDIKVIQGIMKECDNEVINGLTKIEKNWIPGTKDGRKVKSELIVVVEFKLHESGQKSITVTLPN